METREARVELAEATQEQESDEHESSEGHKPVDAHPERCISHKDQRDHSNVESYKDDKEHQMHPSAVPQSEPISTDAHS